MAGLTCGIRLQESGRHCAIVSTGQSALHFSSGSFDLLSHLPDGTPVDDPLLAIDNLESYHPYRRIGHLRFKHYVEEVPQLFYRAGILVEDVSRQNRYRLTPLGQMKPTWLPFADFRLFSNPDHLPWRRALILNFDGFQDFYLQFIADAFLERGVQCRTDQITLPSIEGLRQSPTEMRSANIAGIFEFTEHIDELVKVVNALVQDADVLVLPAVFGLSSSAAYQYLQARLSCELCLVSTMPPSVPGIRTQRQLTDRFTRLGGIFFKGDTVEKAVVSDNYVEGIYTSHQEDIELRADSYVLATGSFFSRGIIARPDEVYEPIFGLDVQYDADRSRWYDANVFERQPYMSFGVKTDDFFHPLLGGEKVHNLYAIGSILSGFDPVREGCGGGVALLTAFYVADRIINQMES